MVIADRVQPPRLSVPAINKGSAMTIKITAAFLCMIVMAGAGAAQLSADQRATDACLQAFLTKIRPDSSVRLHAGNETTASDPVFKSPTASPLAPYVTMQVEMNAGSRSDGKVFAKSVCIVDRQAVIRSLSVSVADPVKLSQIQSKDLRLAVVIR
jgi:hypothetical protein